MKYFFPQVDDLPVDNSSSSAEGYFRAETSTGLIEKQFTTDRSAVLLFASGIPSTAYVLENGQNKPIKLAEFSSLNDDIKHVHAIKLPDVAGRLVSLALESQAKHNYSIAGPDAWKKQISQWKQEQWTGLVEITSRKLHGFALFSEGESQKSDTIFATVQGFTTVFPEMDSMDDFAWDIITYSHSASTPAYQCAILRHGAMHWSHNILGRYQDMVGLKLLQMMDRELNRQIQSWRWNMEINGSDMMDGHFFAHQIDAAHAYRAIFMAMGTHMNIVIGSNLTQRILNETFEQIHPDEQAALQSQRLIPAAFSE